MSSPVTFEIERPDGFDRAQAGVRIGVLVVIGWIAEPFGVLWFALPIVAAILVSRKGGQRYLDEDGPTVVRALNWIVDLAAYIALLTDRLPSRDAHPVRFDVERSGSPTTRSAILRIVYAIPTLIALAVLTWIASIVWVLATVLVFSKGTYPESWWRFLRAVVGWEARVIAYLASLTDHYPPFRLATASALPAAASES